MEDRYIVVYEMNLTKMFSSTNTYCGEVKNKDGLKTFIQDLINKGATNIRIGKKLYFEVDVLIK